jgi:L-alanine-DL-glutamate epimerase-like enolase superfamily enzyme
VFWLEEPLPGGDLNGMCALRGLVRVAGGEMARTPAELLAALAADALDVLQPDVVLSTGMLRARTIAELALLRHRWFTPHTWTNGLGLLANLHVVAGVDLTWSSPTTRPAGPRSGATFSSPSRSASTPTAAWLFPTLPASAPGSTSRP